MDAPKNLVFSAKFEDAEAAQKFARWLTEEKKDLHGLGLGLTDEQHAEYMTFMRNLLGF